MAGPGFGAEELSINISPVTFVNVSITEPIESAGIVPTIITRSGEAAVPFEATGHGVIGQVG